MSTLGLIALVVGAIWLAGVSFVLILLTRQLDLLRAWAVEQTANPSDGLEVGADVPKRFSTVESREAVEPIYLLFLGGNCQPCREFALEARDSSRLQEMRGRHGMVAVVTGTDAQAEDLIALLPSWFTTVQGSHASELMRGFEVMQTPSIFEIEGGKVTGRAVAGYGLTNFLNLIDAREASDAAKFAGTAGGNSDNLQVTVTAGREASP